MVNDKLTNLRTLIHRDKEGNTVFLEAGKQLAVRDKTGEIAEPKDVRRVLSRPKVKAAIQKRLGGLPIKFKFLKEGDPGKPKKALERRI
ncbi:hypothetical protein LCGC14_0466090 [marine sediment metagenome]|uniref:Uncharacterized protein n=1 Tax=marine sediment metagenome TaxID=412755 RepID=A0A0F9SDW4_9ZZZZ